MPNNGVNLTAAPLRSTAADYAERLARTRNYGEYKWMVPEHRTAL